MISDLVLQFTVCFLVGFIAGMIFQGLNLRRRYKDFYEVYKKIKEGEV
jgi:hypothetical protein